ncbi:MAG: helix-turn-helix domain-containing protein, partial [Xanthomonadaceae bacterium]|nr:helix-turn-helix domain-containing protein [Xanthomonadaceae bacterium]
LPATAHQLTSMIPYRVATMRWAIEVVAVAEQDGVVMSQGVIDLMPPQVKIAMWARSLRDRVTGQQIMDRWGINRSTAYRYAQVINEGAQP